MGDAGSPSNSQAFGLGGASSLRWAYDAAAEGVDADMDHVVWQASQSNCAALNQLLTDANKPVKLASRSPRVKTWTPSPGSTTSDASASSTSLLTTTSSRARHPPKRRPSNTSIESQVARTASKLESNSDALLALIRGVSAKVDESATLKRKAIERARMKAQAKKRDKEMGDAREIVKEFGVTKKWSGVSACAVDAKGKRRHGFEGARGEEEQIALDVDRGAQRMPPPTSVPAHLFQSGTSIAISSSTSSVHSRQDNKPTGSDMSGAQDAHGTRLSSSSSFVATSTPYSAAAAPTRANSHPLYKSHSNSEIDGGKGRISSSTLKPVPSTGGGSILHVIHESRTSGNVAASDLTTAPSGARAPVQPTLKPKAPPVLGMRRPGNSPGPSSSQAFGFGGSASASLPMKQKHFRPPLAKAKIPVPPAPAPAGSQASPTSTSCLDPAAASYGRPAAAAAGTRPEPTRPRPADGFPLASSASADTKPTRTPNASHSGDPNLHCAQHQRVEGAVSEVGSSSLPPEADESFSSKDFDMGIDEDEILKACSMYD